eukprot:7388042-Prymnesium_polylepis.2
MRRFAAAQTASLAASSREVIPLRTSGSRALSGEGGPSPSTLSSCSLHTAGEEGASAPSAAGGTAAGSRATRSARHARSGSSQAAWSSGSRRRSKASSTSSQTSRVCIAVTRLPRAEGEASPEHIHKRRAQRLVAAHALFAIPRSSASSTGHSDSESAVRLGHASTRRRMSAGVRLLAQCRKSART